VQRRQYAITLARANGRARSIIPRKAAVRLAQLARVILTGCRRCSCMRRGDQQSGGAVAENGSMADERRLTPDAQAVLDEAQESIQDEPTAAQSSETVCIAEPTLPTYLKETANSEDRDWDAKALEALANQLTVTNDFYHPLLAAAQELRDLRSVHAALIELLRTVNPNSRSYSRFTHDSRSL
jgi:hypothetical protein